MKHRVGPAARGRRQRRWRSLAVLGITGLALLMPGQALAGGGLKPSEAPLVAIGQHYFGNTAHTANGDSRSVDLWRLPPLLTNDAITVAWHSGGRPNLCLAQNIDDYDWAERGNVCNGSTEYRVADNGSARTALEVRSPTSLGYLEFTGCYTGECESCGGCGVESQSYDFVIESIQHAIGVSLSPKLHMRTSAILTGSANLSSGLPVPDGLTFYLNASWAKAGSAQYSATTSGGSMRSPVSLPPEAAGQTVSFTVTRPADPQYREATSPGLQVKVARPKPETKVVPRHPKRCRRGFKKRRVRGHVRCVRKHHRHRHSYATTTQGAGR